MISLHEMSMYVLKQFNKQQTPQCTEVRFASFLSGGFTTMTVINPLERKLAKHISQQYVSVDQRAGRNLNGFSFRFFEIFCKVSNQKLYTVRMKFRRKSRFFFDSHLKSNTTKYVDATSKKPIANCDYSLHTCQSRVSHYFIASK